MSQLHAPQYFCASDKRWMVVAHRHASVFFAAKASNDEHEGLLFCVVNDE